MDDNNIIDPENVSEESGLQEETDLPGQIDMFDDPEEPAPGTGSAPEPEPEKRPYPEPRFTPEPGFAPEPEPEPEPAPAEKTPPTEHAPAKAAKPSAGQRQKEGGDSVPPKKKKAKKKFRPLKIILLIILFLGLAAGAFWVSITIKYNVQEREVNAAEPLQHGEIDRGIATKDICDFYFNTLTYREQLLYNNILDAAKTCAEKSEVLRYEYDIDTFSKVARYVLADNPDLFYVNFDALVINHGWHRTYVTMAYCAEGDALKGYIADYEKALSEMIAAAADAKSDFERELMLHDHLTEECEYAVDDSDRLHNTAYGALVLKRAYCDGYAYAIKAALDRMDIQSAIVYGSVNGADHVWNMVLIDGKYYHLDSMWDDADLSYGEGLKFHGYFNLSEDRILLDHVYKYREVLPEANGTDDYYVSMGLHAETAEECADIIFNAMVDAAEKERSYIELLCDETSSNEDLKPYFQEAADRANKELDDETFLTAFRVFSASEKSNAVTIQIFYSTPVDGGEEEGGD